MEKVSVFINEPGDRDVPVEDVFTERMYEDLETSMRDAGWTGLEQVRARWNSEYRHRKVQPPTLLRFRVALNVPHRRSSVNSSRIH
jgi:hypothetical protein